jgi:hypothetical protein
MGGFQEPLEIRRKTFKIPLSKKENRRKTEKKVYNPHTELDLTRWGVKINS